MVGGERVVPKKIQIRHNQRVKTAAKSTRLTRALTLTCDHQFSHSISDNDLQVELSVFSRIRFEDYRYISSVGRRFIHYYIKSLSRYNIIDAHLFAYINNFNCAPECLISSRKREVPTTDWIFVLS